MAWLLVAAFFVATCTNFYSYTTLRSTLKEFSVSSKPTRGQYTTAYNVDSKLTDREYRLVSIVLGLKDMDDRVTIIRVLDKRDDGSIGDSDGVPVVGLYANNVIVYDGDLLTLRHELAHFFFDKAVPHDRSEIFAQCLEKVFAILSKEKGLSQ